MNDRHFVISAAIGSLLGVALTLGLRGAMATAPDVAQSATAEQFPSVAFDEDCHVSDALISTPSGYVHFDPSAHGSSPIVARINRTGSNWDLLGSPTPSFVGVTCGAPGHLHFM
ncbi:MAG: hypothetical protein HY078_02930 [Elusimicrobia bacterium]|nr:hypothetical protein [Elusimicrobiota bacterium]